MVYYNDEKLDKQYEASMTLSYKKLWHLLLDRDMNKSDLQRLAGVSWSAISKLSKNENVNTDILLKICATLQCDISDIMEIHEESISNIQGEK